MHPAAVQRHGRRHRQHQLQQTGGAVQQWHKLRMTVFAALAAPCHTAAVAQRFGGPPATSASRLAAQSAHRPGLDPHGEHHAAATLAVPQRHLHILGALRLDERAAQVGVLDLDLGGGVWISRRAGSGAGSGWGAAVATAVAATGAGRAAPALQCRAGQLPHTALRARRREGQGRAEPRPTAPTLATSRMAIQGALMHAESPSNRDPGAAKARDRSATPLVDAPAAGGLARQSAAYPTIFVVCILRINCLFCIKPASSPRAPCRTPCTREGSEREALPDD